MELKGRITIYSTVGCPSCMRAKTALQEKSLPFTDVDLDSHPELQVYVQKRTGKATVPQIFFNNIYVGGSEALQEKFSNEQNFGQLLNEVKNNEVPSDAPRVPDMRSAAEHMNFTNEPDEHAILIMDFKKSMATKRLTSSMSDKPKSSFTGKDLVNWIAEKKGLGKDSAIVLGQKLADQQFFHAINGSTEKFTASDTFYKLLEDDETNALNGGEMSMCQPRRATEVAEDMRRLILKLYGTFLSPDGKKVDYDGIGKSEDFQKYVNLTKELVRADVEKLTREEKLAFFINVYNALVIHGTIKCGHPGNSWQIDRFFSTVKYIIGGQAYTLDDIENGVLRANREGAGKNFKPFGNKDPRLIVALEKNEPLIHFTLVCGAKSCPPIKTFSPQNIDEQLKLAAQAFLEDDCSVSVDLLSKNVTVSQIFEWYRVDFGRCDKEVLEFVYSHMSDSEKKTTLGKLLQNGNYSLSYHPYDWTINS